NTDLVPLTRTPGLTGNKKVDQLRDNCLPQYPKHNCHNVKVIPCAVVSTVLQLYHGTVSCQRNHQRPPHFHPNISIFTRNLGMLQFLFGLRTIATTKEKSWQLEGVATSAKQMKKIQRYHGLVITHNVLSTSNPLDSEINVPVYTMKKNLMAILHHAIKAGDSAKQHRFCPPDRNSWSDWQQEC
ncbi:hypothetical protein pdam_00022418, partial [Pocillopora damicornis]